MKKTWIIVTIVALLGLFFATTQVLASPADDVTPRKTQSRTPGARATERATTQDTRATERAATQDARATERAATQGARATERAYERVNLRGTIAAVDAASLTLTLNDGSTVTVNLTSETRIRIPTLGREATAADLRPGVTVGVCAIQDSSGLLTARIILIIPGKPSLMHRVGVVTDYQPGVSITIQATDGNTYSFLVTGETQILPVERVNQLIVGARVTIIAPRDVTGGEPTAQGIVVQTSGTPAPTSTSEPTDTTSATFTPEYTATPIP